MAHNVFGNSITDDSLKGMPEYTGKPITQTDRARVALHMKNAQDKNMSARRYAISVKESWGVGFSTMCLLYNATGGTIVLTATHDYHGHIGPVAYPFEIANGQWGAFLHVKTTALPVGSSGVVVYRGKNGDGQNCDWIVAWANPWRRLSFQNKVHAEVGEARSDYKDYFQKNKLFASNKISTMNSLHEGNGCKATVATGSDTTTFVEAVLTLQNLE